MRRQRVVDFNTFVALVVAALAISMTPPAWAGSSVVQDAAGRHVEIPDASRIVSIGGSITEILYALGLENRVVGVDSTSSYPPRALTEKANVGYMRALSPEGVLSLDPSLILAAEGSGPKDVVAVLQKAGVPFVVVPDPHSGDGIVEKIKLVARATDVVERGKCLVEAVRSRLHGMAALRARIEKPVRVLFVLSFVNGRAMVAGRKTAADGVITLAGAVNAIDGYEGYKPITDEAIIAAQPDVVLAMRRDGYAVTADTVFAHPAFALTPAAAKRSFIAMDGLYLLGFGPRTAMAARELAGALYPELDADTPTDKEATLADACRK